MKKFIIGLFAAFTFSFPAIADQAAEFGRYKPLYQFLDSTGVGVGTFDMAVAGTLNSPVVYKIQPQPGQIMLIHRLIVHMEDNGTFQVGGYGSISANPLTNGILLEKRRTLDDSVMEDFTAGHLIKSNGDWSSLSHDLTYHSFGGGSTNKFISVRFTFARAGQPLRLTPNTYLAISIRDDLSTLVDHTAMAQGYRLK